MTLALPTSVKEAVALKNERRIFGPPGTGKTTYLSNMVKEYIESKKYRPSEIFVTSFTRAAAAEVASRGTGIPQENIQTLHALGYRALGGGEIAETHIDEWNAWVYEKIKSMQFRMSVKKVDDGESEDDVFGRDRLNSGDDIFKEYAIRRAKCISFHGVGNNPLYKFHVLWSAWKHDTGYIDFQDMIDIPLGRQLPPPNGAKVMICDEFQDFTTAEARLARFWGAQLPELILAGDDDQCQSGSTQVLTTEGYVSMETLDPEKHRVVSYDRAGSEVAGLRSGYAFQKASRPFDGTLYHITADGKTTNCTPNHRFIAKWSREACEKTHVVYLMRKGDRYRIGWCKLFNVENGFHLGARARLEDADAAWILHVTNNRTDASVMESMLSARFGIPTITFREVEGAQHMTNEAIDRTFMLLAQGIPGVQGINLRERAEPCLRACGRDIAYPIWTQQKAWERRGGTSIMEIEAVNMISDLMLIPSHQGGKEAQWCPITVMKRAWSGTVYSLDVERHHLYISDGLVTHNCLYSFKGASADNFIYPELPPEQVHVLQQSWRVSREVQRYAERWIRNLSHRYDKKYEPRDFDGQVIYEPVGKSPSGAVIVIPSDRENFKTKTPLSWEDPEFYLRHAEEYIEQGKSIMFLASCSYMLDPLKALMRQQGIPFHNPYRRKRIDWNPLNPSTNGVSSVERLLAFLRPSSSVWGDQEARMWTIEDFMLWTEALQKSAIFKHHGKTSAAIQRYYNELSDSDPEALSHSLDLVDHLSEWLKEDALQHALNQSLEWFEDNLLAGKRDGLKFPLHVARGRGGATLFKEPNIIIGTIHSVKGGTTDVVYLFPDLSAQGMEEKETSIEGRDALCRMFYVGMTRARETLVVCRSAGKNCVRFKNPASF